MAPNASTLFGNYNSTLQPINESATLIWTQDQTDTLCIHLFLQIVYINSQGWEGEQDWRKEERQASSENLTGNIHTKLIVLS